MGSTLAQRVRLLSSGPGGRSKVPRTHAARWGRAKSGVREGQGWGNEVDGHMAWALGYPEWVPPGGGHKVFGGHSCGFCALVMQYLLI